MSVVIYHNPRCSKSRQTLALIESQGITPKIIKYLENPPSKHKLKKIVKLLNVPVTDIIRFKESLAKELGITKKDDRSEGEWLEILANHPVLMERPIVLVNDDSAAVGRPPENVLAILA